MLKNKNGITLIALVVTIVVLLILAGASISLIVDNNGIIKKSKDAKREYKQAQTNEQTDLDDISEWIDGQLGKLPETEETKPYLPNDFTKEKGTNLDNGLVVKDSSGNEYVWVEVPRKIEVYKTSGLKITEFSDEELEDIKTDLINYTKNYKDNSYSEECSDEWHEGCGISSLEIYKSMYNKMLKSVYQNGGFWIGRYEIGIDENTARSFGEEYATEHSITGQTPVIKRNKIPYTWIRCSQAEELAETFTPSGYTSSLMFGLQWDLVCKHLETKGINPGTTATSLQNAIKNNSTDWGNYYNASFTVINTNAMYSEDCGVTWKNVSDEKNGEYQKVSSKGVLLTTGADTRNSMLNIYDFAGNVWEWTLEKTSNIAHSCTSRGGYYDNKDNLSASYRSGASATFSNFYGGIRVSIY